MGLVAAGAGQLPLRHEPIRLRPTALAALLLTALLLTAWYANDLMIAAERAYALMLRHEANGVTFPDDDPFSGMFRFLSSIDGLIARDPQEE